MRILAALIAAFLLRSGYIAEPSTPPPAEPTPTATVEILPLEGKIICVDPGHCVTPETGKGHRELVSPLSKETKPLYTTGTRGANMTEEQLNLAVGLRLWDALEALGADVAIHIHADGNNDTSVHGVSVLVPSGNLLGTPSIAGESTRLGELMVNAVAEETGAKNRGAVPRSDMTAFNFLEIPTVLTEMGFMTNPEEDARLETPEYQAKIVTGMVTALLSWYGVE